jgi:hypothetical protein
MNSVDLEWIQKGGSLSQLFEVVMLKGYRSDSLGEHREISIEVWDGGDAVHDRYQIIARDIDGREARSGFEDSIQRAVSLMPWSNLEQFVTDP